MGRWLYYLFRSQLGRVTAQSRLMWHSSASSRAVAEDQHGFTSLRAALKKLGATFMLESVVARWHGDRAEVRSLLDGSTTEVAASAIVTATTNTVFNDVELALAETDTRFHVIGDAAAPRLAPYAFHDGRKIGLTL